MATNSGAFKKGEKRENQGKRGQNKTTAQLKDMILAALDQSGGVEYLTAQAENNPNAFLSLVGKVLPMTVLGAGADGAHMVHVSVKFD